MTHALNHAPRFSCEQLESRENPAGNMTAFIAGDGALYVTGDAADNLISIQQNAIGDLVIFGRNGTTVNGQSAVYLGRGFVTGVSVVSDAGNDLIEMIGLQTAGSIGVLAGDENDSVAMYGVQAGWVHLMMQGGDDIIVTDAVAVNNAAVIDGGNGFDTIDYRTWGISAPFLSLPSIERQVSTNAPPPPFG